MAVGYWGGCSIHKRIVAGQIPGKIIGMEQDKLVAMGRAMYLWLPVPSTPTSLVSSLLGANATVPCSCDKETAKTSDDRFFSCYGTRIIPGYVMFLHETHFFSSAEAAGYTLVGCALDFKVKPNRILLTSGAVSGTIETADKAYTNPNGDDWELRLDVFERSTGAVISAEFSTDGGATFFPASAINGASKPTGAGNIRFRITMTRAAASDKAPAFEILRLRRIQSENVNQQLVKARSVDNSFLPGQILMARTWVMERTIRDAGRGRNTDHAGDKAWTTPLNFFDTSITPETPPAAIQDRESGPHPFYEVAYGIRNGIDRYALYQESYSEQLLAFTHQAFFDRLVQKGENYHLVF
jgi:hypothetical protein